MISYEKLNSKFLKEFPKEAKHPLGLRLRRSLSWYERSLQEKDDPDAKFVFCWIGFNSLYGIDIYQTYDTERSGPKELVLQKQFFSTVIGLDRDKRIHYAILDEIEKPIQRLLDNEYIFKNFWIFAMGEQRFKNWAKAFNQSKRQVETSFDNEDTETLLITVFERLYILRNQILHGGATWKGSVNRSQVEDGSVVISSILPLLIDTVMLGPECNWGEPSYPVL